MKPPAAKSKNFATWDFIRSRFGEEEAQRIYQSHLLCKRTNTYNDDEKHWRQVEHHLHRGAKSPYEDYSCQWCGRSVDFDYVQSDQVFCPDLHPYMDRRLCTVDMARSTKRAISTIEFVYKLITQHLKCVCCNNRFQPNQMEQGHVISRNHDGPDTYDNIRIVCNTCNKIMRDKNMGEFIEDGAKGVWSNMEGLSYDQSVRNLLRYIHELKIGLRCKAIIEGTIPPHGEHEGECAVLVLAWIQKHAKPFMLTSRTYPSEDFHADTSPDCQDCA